MKKIPINITSNKTVIEDAVTFFSRGIKVFLRFLDADTLRKIISAVIQREEYELKRDKDGNTL